MSEARLDICMITTEVGDSFLQLEASGAMEVLRIPQPFSAGVFLSYRCSGACRHCLYACSPRWPADWISIADAERVLAGLATAMRDRYPPNAPVGVNEGLHLTGGEPFLNFELLIDLVEIAAELGIPGIFVETNASWCVNEGITRDRLRALKSAGLRGILVSVNPFLLEHVPFERTRRAVRVASEIFGPRNVLVYQGIFYREFLKMGIRGTLPLEDYLRRSFGLAYAELLPSGRAVYKLAHLFPRYPARRFFGLSCRRELIRDWHIHVDNYCHYIPGFCAGISLGDARHLEGLYKGIKLEEFPVLKALLSDLKELYRLGVEYGYRERTDGYVSKCHFCIDIRRHLVHHGAFRELAPLSFYEHLED